MYSLRIGFSGDSSTALQTYYTSTANNLGFKRTIFSFTPSESLIGTGLGFEEDVTYTQATPFDFRILERTINVKFNLR